MEWQFSSTYDRGTNMDIFFACLTLAGAGIVLFAVILMLADKKRMHDYREDLAEMEDNLIEVIEDAEVLIKEMNKFSDYAVSRLEEKHNLLLKTLEEADQRIRNLSGTLGISESPETQKQNEKASLPEVKNEESAESILQSRLFNRKKSAAVEDKREEIIRLSKSGMNSTEIARLLNMGKGEIELIARISK